VLEKWFALWRRGTGSRSGSSSPTASCTAGSPHLLQHARAVHVRERHRAPLRLALLFAYYLAAWSLPRLTQLGFTAITGGRLSRPSAPPAGIYGLLLASECISRGAWSSLYLPPIPMQARYFVILFGSLELVFRVTGTGGRRRALRTPGRAMLGGWLVIQYAAAVFPSPGGAEQIPIEPFT